MQSRGWRSMHLLDAGEQPAAGAVDRLHQVPHLAERRRLRAGPLALLAREADARPVLAVFGRQIEQPRLEAADVGLLPADTRLHVVLQRFEQLRRGDLADLLEVAAIVGELQLDE